ncbi:T9SS type A sorting domain-containing protein [Flavobacteriaceae bacterium]|nr:T9SS type A sorting domain-containing protein [Flavobacteriaceae bacterium]
MKIRYYYILSIVLAFSINCVNSQNVVNFTTDEGFTSGALYNQPNWDANFQTSTWMVDASQGMVTATDEWKRAAWEQGFSLSGVGDEITFRVDLNFTGNLTAQNNPLIKIGFSASSDVGGSNPPSSTVFLSTTADNEDNPGGSLQLRNNTNSLPLSLETSLSISGCQGVNGLTDDLAVVVTLSLGENATTSTISAKLLNITDGTSSNLGSYSGIDSQVFDAATSNIYGFFHAQSFKVGNGLSAINVKKVSITTNIDIFPKVKRMIGEISTLDRSKYFNIHSNANDVEADLYSNYNISQVGRQFWSPGSAALQSTGAVGIYPDPLTGDTEMREVRKYVATDHPYKVYAQGLDPIPFADWVVEYFKNHVDTYLRPEYYEPMNEPFVHARDFYDEPDWDPVAEATVKLEMAQFFKHVGQKIHAAPELANMKVIGYSAAYPTFEKNDFSIWDQNMKMFMDEAGADMDGFSTHLYDGVNQIGQDTRRSGSNMEAILDLIETYSYVKWGIIKPHAITEFGGIENGEYNDIMNVQSIRSQNSILFGLLERTDRMEIAIPFTTGKSTWHITEENNYMPYKAVLYKPIPIGVPLDEVTGWEYTERIHFYDLWKDVSGDRILIRTDNMDVLVQGFLDGNKLHIALNNLDDFDLPINLNLNGNLPNISQLTIKSLIIHPDADPDYTIQTSTELLKTYGLKKNETAVLEFTFSEPITFDNVIQSERYYSTTYLQAIQANNPINYNFNNVDLVGNSGYAMLAMSIGRKHDRSKSPTVIVNGISIPVPSNWKGYNQIDRDDFFGTIEIPVPLNIIQENNSVSITFEDSNGHLSSLVLNVATYDSSLLGINSSEVSTQKLKLYPNPTAAQLNIVNAKMDSVISIYSITGVRVFISKYDGLPINLDQLDNGLYFVKIDNKTLKLIIKD